MEKVVSFFKESRKEENGTRVPHPYSASAPNPVHTVYMHSGIYPQAKNNKGRRTGVAPLSRN